MSTTCIHCVNAVRTGNDLLCDDCRTAAELQEMRDAKREQIEHDRYEAQADEAHALARETQEIDDEYDPEPEA